MKKYLLLLAIAIVGLSSCQEKEEDVRHSISIDPAELVFGADGKEQTVTVTSSDDWELAIDDDWCTPSIYSGESGDKVTFKLEPYDDTENDRTTHVVFKCGSCTVKLPVTQEARKHFISFTPAQLLFDIKTSAQKVTVASTDTWKVEECPEWIELSAYEGGSGSIITVTVTNLHDSCAGDIVFTCAGQTVKLPVSLYIDGNASIKFKDPNFLKALLVVKDMTIDGKRIHQDIDRNIDGQISVEEAKQVTHLQLGSKYDENKYAALRNIDEIRYFTSLKQLKCNDNNLTSLDLSKNTSLECLDCSGNYLTTLKLGKKSALVELSCRGNELTILDVSGCTALTDLNCGNNQLTTLDVSECTALKELYCYENQLTTLDVSGCTALKTLNCYENQLTTLDLSGYTTLKTLNCDYNQLTSLDVSECTTLTELSCDENQLTSLDVSGCSSLPSLDCSNNQLTSLDVSGCTALKELYCSSNQLTSLDVSECTALKELYCYENQLTTLDLSKNTSFKTLYGGHNQWTVLNLSNHPSLESISCEGDCMLDLSGCTALTSVDCNVSTLDLSGCTALTGLSFSNTKLTTLNVSGCTALTELSCYDNQLITLNASECTALKTLNCNYNQLTSLDVSGCTALTDLYCYDNPLNKVTISSSQQDRRWVREMKSYYPDLNIVIL